MENKWVKFIFYLLGTLILSSLAFNNNYPFVYSDTGTYIRSGFTDFLPPDRPVFYGIFLRHFSLAESFWIPAVFQAFCVFWLIALYFKELVSVKHYLIYANIVVVFLIYTTGLGYHALQLVPDIFSGMLILSAVALILFKDIHASKKIFLWMLLAFSLMVHTSNILMLGFFAGILFALSFRKEFAMHRKFSLLFLGIGFGLYFLFPSLNYLLRNEYSHMKDSHLFLMGRMSESGILKNYLDKNCEENQYRLCKYKENLPTNSTQYIFSGDSPVALEGGGDSLRDEHNVILKEILTSGWGIKMFVLESVKGTFKQFFKFDAGDGFIASYQEDSPPYREIKNHMSHELGEYVSSRQFARRLDFADLNQRQHVVVLLSMIILFAFLFIRDERILQLRRVVLFTLLLVLGNAWSCATFANAIDRLQARIIWILPLLAVIVLWELYQKNYFASFRPAIGRQNNI